MIMKDVTSEIIQYNGVKNSRDNLTSVPNHIFQVVLHITIGIPVIEAGFSKFFE